jgi:cephalosporin hydroxylase
MSQPFDIETIPAPAALTAEFAKAVEQESAASYLNRVYETGVLFDVNGRREMTNETSMQMPEGQILWYVARHLRPNLVMETGFGRGGSAAFFLSALAPWGGKLISIDPAFRHWAGDVGTTYVSALGLAANHTLVEVPSEIFLPSRLLGGAAPSLKLAYVDGSHHFDGTLFDFMYFDRMLEVGGVIGIDDAHAPAVRTVASFVANNLPYKLHYATKRLVFCQKLAQVERDWGHFRPFTSSSKSDWDVHAEAAEPAVVPNATFGPEAR